MLNFLNFEVYYDNGDYHGSSKVYAIDTNGDRFLVINVYGDFLWVNTKDCIIKKEGIQK